MHITMDHAEGRDQGRTRQGRGARYAHVHRHRGFRRQSEGLLQDGRCLGGAPSTSRPRRPGRRSSSPCRPAPSDGCRSPAARSTGSSIPTTASSPFPAAFLSSTSMACSSARSAVSGSSVENDEAVAKAGVAVLGVAKLPRASLENVTDRLPGLRERAALLPSATGAYHRGRALPKLRGARRLNGRSASPASDRTCPAPPRSGGSRRVPRGSQAGSAAGSAKGNHLVGERLEAAGSPSRVSWPGVSPVCTAGGASSITSTLPLSASRSEIV